MPCVTPVAVDVLEIPARRPRISATEVVMQVRIVKVRRSSGEFRKRYRVCERRAKNGKMGSRRIGPHGSAQPGEERDERGGPVRIFALIIFVRSFIGLEAVQHTARIANENGVTLFWRSNQDCLYPGSAERIQPVVVGAPGSIHQLVSNVSYT